MSGECIKYYIMINGNEKEVTKEEYIRMEESCGFFSKFDGEIATSSFRMSKGAIDIKGRTSCQVNAKHAENIA